MQQTFQTELPGVPPCRRMAGSWALLKTEQKSPDVWGSMQDKPVARAGVPLRKYRLGGGSADVGH